MAIFLNIHRERTDSHQQLFRDRYRAKDFSFQLVRTVSNKGEIMSEVAGGQIEIVLDGFGDENLFGWLLGGGNMEDGEIVATDENSRVVEKVAFRKARASKYKLSFDAATKLGVRALLTLSAREITTDNDLHFETK